MGHFCWYTFGMIKLAGILNITPDSFSDGGLFVDPHKALAHAEQLFTDGADLLDVGAESTNPWSTPLTAGQEWQRLAPVLPELLKKYPGKISLDTYHPETAQKALELAPDVIINDITGMGNPAMVDVVARYKAYCIVSQLPAPDPQTAHKEKHVGDVNVVLQDLLAKEKLLINKGVPVERIIVDPGIGFGKTPELNKQLLSFAKLVPGKRVMIGYSRKRFLGDERMKLAPNLAAGKIATESGAAFLRVHDVAGHAVLKQV